MRKLVELSAVLVALLIAGSAAAADRMPAPPMAAAPGEIRQLLAAAGIGGQLLAQQSDCQTACFAQGNTCKSGCRSIQDSERRQACLNSCNTKVSTCQRNCRN